MSAVWRKTLSRKEVSVFIPGCWVECESMQETALFGYTAAVLSLIHCNISGKGGYILAHKGSEYVYTLFYRGSTHYSAHTTFMYWSTSYY